MNLYFDGLERSGNVFFQHCINYGFNVNTISTREHSINILKRYDKKDPFIVPIRDILESITSAYIYWQHLYQTRKDLEVSESLYNPYLLIMRHTEYIQYLVDNDIFFIAPFHEFTKDHNKVLDIINYRYPQLERTSRLSAEQVIDLAKSKGVWDHSPESGNFPRQSSKQKDAVTKLFLDKYANELYSIQNNINILYDRYYVIANLAVY